MYDIKTKTLIDRRELLRIKALSLMVEAKLIRNEEHRQKAMARHYAIPDPILQREMQLHRTRELRQHSRLTHLARGFIKGMALNKMEQYPKNLLTGDDWGKIIAMVRKYGTADAVKFTVDQQAKMGGKVYAIAPPFVRKERPAFVRPLATA